MMEEILKKIDEEIENEMAGDFTLDYIDGLLKAKEFINSKQREHGYIHSCITCRYRNQCLDNNGKTLTCQNYESDETYQPYKSNFDAITETHGIIANCIYNKDSECHKYCEWYKEDLCRADGCHSECEHFELTKEE
jgi:hypothetical protein